MSRQASAHEKQGFSQPTLHRLRAMHYLIRCSLVVLATFFVSIYAQMHGFDLSSLEDVMKDGWSFQDINGAAMPLEQILVNHGMDLVRLRIFTTPGHLEQQLNLAKKIAKIKPDTKFLVNLHLSDSWANPGRQNKPAAWKDRHGLDLQRVLRTYVKSTLLAFWQAKITVDVVSLGNENNMGFLFPDGQVTQNKDYSWSFDNFNKLWLAGRAGVDDFKAILKQRATPRVMLHISNGWKEWPVTFVDGMVNAKVRVPKEAIDVVGLSIYPIFWAKNVTLQGIENTILGLASRHITPMIVETAWPTSCTKLQDPEAFKKKWPTLPLSPVGQVGWVHLLLNVFKKVSEELRPHTAVIWFEPAFMTTRWLGTQCEDMLLFQDVGPKVARARSSVQIFEKL